MYKCLVAKQTSQCNAQPLHTNGPTPKQTTVSVTVVKVRSACTHISHCSEYAYRYVTTFHVYVATVEV